uniref:Uncharacterized protein n=1 Tax=Rhizophora mucronata TaxID=61149 RepID=A0A2P2PWT2_RHIMU
MQRNCVVRPRECLLQTCHLVGAWCEGRARGGEGMAYSPNVMQDCILGSES